MKLKGISLLLAGTALAATISGCSSGNDDKEISQLKEDIAKLQQENQDLKAKLKDAGTPAAAAAAAPSDAPQASPAPESAGTGSEQPAIVKGQPLVLDGIGEYTVTKTSFAKKVIPSAPGTFYTYYEAKEPGTTYLAITLKVKNLGSTGKGADTFADVTVKYDNNYEYDTFSALEENGGENFTYTNITDIEPLKNGTLVFLAEVPTEVETDAKPLYADIKIEGETYKYSIR